MSSHINRHIIVIGAGIVGAAIAYYLSKSGARVTILGAEQARNCATGASFAWINATVGNPEPYVALRIAAINEWHQLEDEIGGISPSWTGSIVWEGMTSDQLNSFIQEHQSWNYSISRIERGEISKLEPHLKTPPPFAALADKEGVVDPLAATDALLAAACMQGARLATGVKVLEIMEGGGRVLGVKTEENDIAASDIVVAAGINTGALLAPLGFGLPMDNQEGLLIHSKPLPAFIKHVLTGKDLDLRQDTFGRIIAGSSFGGTPLTEAPDRLAASLVDLVQNMLDISEPIELDRWTIGCRPMPADGFPAVGPVPVAEGLFAAVTHSGITLAPAIGKFLAHEILTGEAEPLLTLYRPQRFS